ncbi:MAG: hypothetical protein L3J34_03420 [Flavobacteriaceae bacterium]|nr:hypothetical protein [Flavobacteriaceae bacterium]
MLESSDTSKSKLVIGTIVLVVGFMSPLLIPLVVDSDLPISYKRVLSGLLAFGIPELFMIIAVAIMGKQGFEFLKNKALNYLKIFAPSDEVSLTRYRIGLVMFSLPIIIGITQPYLELYLPFFKQLPIWWTISSDILFVSSFFILGGDFWDKLSGLFKYNVKVIKEKE